MSTGFQPVPTEIEADGSIPYDVTPPHEIRGTLESYYVERLYDPLQGPQSTERLAAQRTAWQEEGATVVFTSGVFDLLHQNHRAYLLHVKRAAMPLHYERHLRPLVGYAWEDLSDSEQQEAFAATVLDNKLKLIVSVDGNESVARRKGFKPEKGGTARPIYHWNTRARDVLSATFSPNGTDLRATVDAVTMHDDADTRVNGTPHAGIMEIGSFVHPDVWGVFVESDDIMAASRTTYREQLAHTSLVVLPAHEFFGDELLGGSFKTTAVAQRIVGTAALQGGKGRT